MSVLPRFLGDNRANDTGATAAYSGSIVGGFGIPNSSDWRDFTLFEVESGVSTLDYTMAADADMDAAGIWPVVISGVTGDIVLSYESAPAVFTVLATFTGAFSNSLPQLKEFTNVTVLTGRIVRWTFTVAGGSAQVRQLAGGVELIAPIGQRDGLSPPNLSWGYIVNNQIAVDGSILSRSTRRLDRKTMVILEFLSETWVRTTWEPFAQHMSRKACWYAWNIDEYPAEVTFASAESISPPKNNTPYPFMSVEMPLRNLE